MYSILHETDDATTVNFSACGQFITKNSKQLVTVGAKCLKFYRLNPYARDKQNSNCVSNTKLECMLSFTLMAPVRGLAVARLKDYPEYDSLALTFDDAKLSIVNINPATMCLNTLSLHSIEDEFLRDGYFKDIHHPELRADPDNRCCAFIVYGRHLAIVPFSQNRINKGENRLGKDGRQILLHSYTTKLRSLDERLVNVHDMCFLHGYYEPTLLFLYEPIQTTAGRGCVRYDTVCILAVSLNLDERVHAVVWNFAGLPMTVDRCLPVLQPIGGVCLFGANEIIYLNQSVPPRDISLNSCAEDYTRFPLSNQQQDLRITLDGCVVQTIPSAPNDILVVSKEGTLYILSLEIDQANVVKDIHLTKTYVTSIPCSLTFCSTNFLFVGSRLGDSQLLHFNCEQQTRPDQTNNALVNNHCKIIFDEDDICIYGEEFCKSFFIEESFMQLRRCYKFDIVDSLQNVGPCKWLRACNPSYISDIFRKKSRDIYFDMMTASGHGKDSALCFFHRTIRPQLITSSYLEDAQQIWTIGKRLDGTQKYLIISRERSSIVLELTNDMVELDIPLFCQTESTILAGDFADGTVAVQVTPTSIIMVANDAQLDAITVDSNFPVINASIADPFIVLLTLNGRFLLYHFLSNHHRVVLQPIHVLESLKHEKSPITSICLYKDLSGISQFCTEDYRMDFDKESQQELIETLKKESTEINPMDSDDIETYLYEKTNKDSEVKKGRMGEQNNLQEGQDQNRENIQDPLDNLNITSSYWLYFIRENGTLYIYNVPELKLVFMTRKFNQAHELLYDDVQSAYDDEYRPHPQALMNTPLILPQAVESRASDIIVKQEEIVVELQVYGLGFNHGRPILSALVDDMVIFYEMFSFDNRIPGHLAIRFRRILCTVVIRKNRFLGLNGRAPVEAAREAEDRHKQCICPFTRIGRLLNGIFITGSYPSMLILERGEPRLQPMTIDGQICSFAQFNNENCTNGFLYLTKVPEHTMRVAMLNPEIDYDCSYPFWKIPIGQTIYQALYILQSELVMLVISEKRPNKTVCTIVNEEKQVETHERDDNFILPMIDHFTLKLFATEDWNFVPNADFEFDDFEMVTCCEEVLLSSESTLTGVKNYLAIGTAQNYGEEVYVRGRVLLFELIEVVPEEGFPTTRHRLKTIYDKEQKGPVTSLCSINGFLLTGMAQKIFIWQFRDNDLHGVSFLDMHFYVHHIITFREFALACDLYRSLSLIRYQEDFKALSLVSRDLRPTAPTPMTANFLVDHKQLAFLLTDELSNLTLFSYQPETKESIGGERLIIRAALNIGSLINSTVRIKGHTSECFVDAEHQSATHTCYFATLDGSFGIVRPLTEKVFRRLHMLQQVINMHVPQPAGLNPKGARTARPQKTGTNQQISAAKNIVDGLLVMQYLHLSTQEKADLARKLGTSRYQIIDDLVEFIRTVTHY